MMTVIRIGTWPDGRLIFVQSALDPFGDLSWEVWVGDEKWAERSTQAAAVAKANELLGTVSGSTPAPATQGNGAGIAFLAIAAVALIALGRR